MKKLKITQEVDLKDKLGCIGCERYRPDCIVWTFLTTHKTRNSANVLKDFRNIYNNIKYPCEYRKTKNS